jgi:hypothetical protein
MSCCESCTKPLGHFYNIGHFGRCDIQITAFSIAAAKPAERPPHGYFNRAVSVDRPSYTTSLKG